MRRRLRMHMVVAAIAVASALAGCDRGGGEVTEATATSPGESSGEAAGAVASDDRYRTTVEPESLPVDQTRDVELVVVPADGLKVNREYPNWKLSLEPPETIELGRQTFSREDFELGDAGARVSTSLSAAETGAVEIPGRAGFSVCNDETCHIMRDERLSFRVQIETNRDHPGGDESPQR